MAGIHFIAPNILSYNPPAAPGYVTDGLTAFWEVASGDTSTWTDITVMVMIFMLPVVLVRLEIIIH